MLVRVSLPPPWATFLSPPIACFLAIVLFLGMRRVGDFFHDARQKIPLVISLAGLLQMCGCDPFGGFRFGFFGGFGDEGDHEEFECLC